MIKHDELTYCIQKKYPTLLCGKDFWTKHDVDKETGEQVTSAELVGWARQDIPQPTEEELAELVKLYWPEARVAVASFIARAQRNTFLTRADGMFGKAMDTGNMDAVKAIGAYRQALRDVTKQSGFPFDIQWPVAPEV